MTKLLNRRKFLKTAGLGTTIAATAPGFYLRQKSANRKPNIILIMADDLGYNELGCYGQKKIHTPNIDALAAGGMRFTQLYGGSAGCAPSRCNLMSGMHGGHAYVRDNHEIGSWESYRGQLPLPAEIKTVAEDLKNDGYHCGAFGKWGLGEVGSSGDPLNCGFDTFYGYNCQRHAHNYYPRYLIKNRDKHYLKGNNRETTGEQYAPQLIADELMQFVRNNSSQPFFAYYPSVLPHLALQAPEEAIAAYADLWEDTPYAGKSYLPQQKPRACYAAMISFLDKQVGRLMDLLDEAGIADNTIVFFTSDNGTTYLKKQVDYEFFQSVGPLRGLKGSLHEGGIRVPLIASWPGRIKANSVSDQLCANYDLFSTIHEMTGAINKIDTDGISLAGTLLHSTHKQNHEFLFWDFAGYGGQIAVRYCDWKGIIKNIKKNPDAKLELYNLREDIGERNDVAGSNPAIVKKIESIIRKSRTKPEFAEFSFGKYFQ